MVVLMLKEAGGPGPHPPHPRPGLFPQLWGASPHIPLLPEASAHPDLRGVCA